MRSFLGKLATIDQSTLTTKEKRIVEYIKGNLKEIVDTNMKIERMAQEVDSGFSAIYGLLNKLNIKGYRDLSISLANDAENQGTDGLKSSENVVASYINVIRQNYALIEKRGLIKTLNIIKDAKRIFVNYWENALMGPAQEMERFLFNQKKETYLVDNDQDTLEEKIQTVSKNDVFFFYSKYGTSTRLARMIDRIHEGGGKIIFISGKIAPASISNKVDVEQALLIDNPDAANFDGNVSKSVPFHYFNDLLSYHFLNLDVK